MKLSREGLILLAICVADLTTTIWFVSCHGAEEANPLMRPFLQMGVGAFILAKALFCVVPVALIEWARHRNPQFVTHALRMGIVLYIGFYGMGVWKINRQSGEVTYTFAEMVAIYQDAARAPTEEDLRAHRIMLARQQGF